MLAPICLTHRGPCGSYREQCWAVPIDKDGWDGFLGNTSFFGEYFIFTAGVTAHLQIHGCTDTLAAKRAFLL